MYIIRDREGGNVFDTAETMEEARRVVRQFVEEDISNGEESNEDFYEIVEDLEECPICGEKVPREGMALTYDCHGIPFRHVCWECYDKICNEKGYDGEYYTELDENLDYDY